jgi:hypothetical protein
MITITCPKCNTDSKLSLIQPTYVGPHKCWKCKELFTLRIENNMVRSCEPMTPEELERHRQWEEARNKSRGQ